MRAERTDSGGAGGRGLDTQRQARWRRRARVTAAAAGAVVEALELRCMMSAVVYESGFTSGSADGHGTWSTSGTMTTNLGAALTKAQTNALKLTNLGQYAALRFQAKLYLMGDTAPSASEHPTGQFWPAGAGGPQWTVEVAGGSATSGTQVLSVNFASAWDLYTDPAPSPLIDPATAIVTRSGTNRLGFNHHGEWCGDGTPGSFSSGYTEFSGADKRDADYALDFLVPVTGSSTASLIFKETGTTGSAYFSFDDVTVTAYTVLECPTCSDNLGGTAAARTPGASGKGAGGAVIQGAEPADYGPSLGVVGSPRLVWLGPDAGASGGSSAWTADARWVGTPLVAVYLPGRGLPLWFDGTTSATPTFTARDGYKGTLAVDGNEVVLTEPDGTRTRYQGGNYGTADPGRFVGQVEPGGASSAPSALDAGTGPLAGITYTDAGGHAETTAYGYADGRLTSVTVTNGAGVSSKVSYDYYGSSPGLGGVEGAVKFATEYGVGGSAVTGTTYYRYWKTGDADFGTAQAWDGAPKFTFGPAAVARFLGDYPGTTLDDLDDLDEAYLSDYADTAYTSFDDGGNRRVTGRVDAGAGAVTVSTTTRGPTVTAAGTNLANVEGFNIWKYRTQTGHADGTAEIVYKNYLGDVMLEAFKAANGDVRPVMFYAYGERAGIDAGQVVLTAHPSAFEAHSGKYYDDAKADLLNRTGNNYYYLSDTVGLIEVSGYHAVTTATAAAPGGAAGHSLASMLLNGEARGRTAVLVNSASNNGTISTTVTLTVAANTNTANWADDNVVVVSGAANAAYNGSFVIDAVTTVGTNRTFTVMLPGNPGTSGGSIEVARPVLTDATAYFVRTVGGATVYPVAAQTQFTGDDQTGGRTTTHAYAWFPGTVAMRSESVTAPAVATIHNGSNVAVSTTSVFDRDGRTTYSIDGGGHVTAFTYDADTGAMTRQVVDAKSTYVANVLADAPVGYWRLGETSGTAIADSSGNLAPRNGTSTGTITLAQTGALHGDADKAALFGGGRVRLPDDTLYAPLSGGAATVEAWFKTTGYGVILGYGNNATPSSSTHYTPAIYVGDNGILQSDFWDFGSTGSIRSNAFVDDGQWHHVAVTTDGATAVAYLDGHAYGQQSGAIDPLDMHYNWIGDGTPWYSGGSHSAFDGAIDDVAVYAAALTADRVAAHYQAGRGTTFGATEPYAARVLADAPVGYWRLGESSGTSAADATGHGHTGTYLNGVTLGASGALAADRDAAPTFDGSDDYVTVPDAPSLEITGDVTLEAWVYRTSTRTYAQRVIGKGSGAGRNYGLWVIEGHDNAQVLFEQFEAGGGGSTGVISVGTIGKNAWHHIVGVAEGDRATIYIDGAPTGVDARVGTPVTSSDDLLIGYGQYGNLVEGKIDEAALYDYALTPAQIAAHYAAGLADPSVAADGLDLTTTYDVDAQGRVTRVADARENDAAGTGDVTYTVYDDANHATRTYRGWTHSGTGTNTVYFPTGPVEVSRTDLAGGYSESLTFAYAPGTNATPLGTEAITAGNIRSLSRTHSNLLGQTDTADNYFTLSGQTYTASLTLGSGYLRTTYAYDANGRTVRTLSPDGTIRRTVYDEMGRATSQWAGTNDTGATDADPANGGSPNNMVKVSETVYDAGGIGDGNVTQTRAVYANSGTNTSHYDTDYAYDWRDRQTDQRGPDKVATKYTLDNLGETLRVDTYADGDADFDVDWSGTNSSQLRARTDTAYDELGRAYQTTTFNVAQPGQSGTNAGRIAPGLGQVGHALTTNTFFNDRGMAVKVLQPNGLFTKMAYDGAGRTVATYTGYDAADATDSVGGSPWRGAQTLDGDTVIQQNKTIYDAAGNAVTTVSYERFEFDTTTVGELGAASNKAFIQVGVSWYDRANRMTRSTNYGRDNGGTRYVFNTGGALIDTGGVPGLPDAAEGTPPASNSTDDYIVSGVAYDDAGNPFATTDNLGRVTQTSYDLLGRRTKLVENVEGDGVVTETDTDENRTTEWHYDDHGRLSFQRALNPKGANTNVVNIEFQDTTYLYESPFDGSWATNVIYPDSSDTTSSGTDQVKTVFDRLGRVTQTTDQRRVVHDFAYDSAGRPSFDKVTLTASTPATNVASAVLGAGRTYDDIGRAETVTNYAGTNTASAVVNQVAWTYDGWGNVVKSEQAHDGAVVPGTTPAVQYAYDDGLPGNSTDTAALFVRLDRVTYPGPARVVVYAYGSPTNAAGLTSTNGHYLNRVDTISNALGGTNLATYAEYRYVGGGRLVQVRHPVNGFYGPQLVYNTGGTGAYDRLDRFGRVLDQRWQYDSLTGDSYDGYEYAYDRAGNISSRQNYATGQIGGLDNAYAYDGLDRLEKFQRGTLSGGSISSSNTAFIQDWGTGGGTSGAASGLDALGNWSNLNNNGTTQTRTNNGANEITGVGQSGFVTPTYDAAGNMLSGPMANGATNQTRLWFTYDAWNRLVTVKADSGGSPGSTIATYEYDALNRRVQKTTGGHTDATFYNEDWQRLEVRRDGDADAREQFIWDANYIDTPVVRFFDGDTDGGYGGGGDNTLYYLTDANHNVTAIFDAASQHVEERYVYGPHGGVTIYDRTWSNVLGSSAYENNTGFGGYVLDAETGFDYSRNRYYETTLGTWVSRDIAGYIDGANLYQYVTGQAISHTDPTGLFKPWIHNSLAEESSRLLLMKADYVEYVGNVDMRVDVLEYLSPPYHAQAPGWVNLLADKMYNIKNIKPEPGQPVGAIEVYGVLQQIGAALHILQDFYSHTDWVDGSNLWNIYVRRADDTTSIAAGLNAVTRPGVSMGPGHPPHARELLYLNDIENRDTSIEKKMTYFEGGTVPLISDAHNNYAADEPGFGRDQEGEFGLSGSYDRARQSADKQTYVFVAWAKRNMVPCVRDAIFNSV